MRTTAWAWLFSAAAALAQQNNFVGGYGGISTLSADATTTSSGGNTAFSGYKPENGPTLVAFGGRHLNDWFSVMGSYGWNRNAVRMNSGRFTSAQVFWEQSRRVTMHTVIGEGLVYFRPRRSRIRPYLSGGFGVARTENQADGPASLIGPATPPPDSFSSTGPAFRAAVGIDLTIRGGLAFRYSFSETIQGNVTSERLDPPGKRKLANFQNWFGFSYRF
jgi:hypothetical protein